MLVVHKRYADRYDWPGTQIIDAPAKPRIENLASARRRLDRHLSEMECRSNTMMSYHRVFGLRNEWARDREKLVELKAEVKLLEREEGMLTANDIDNLLLAQREAAEIHEYATAAEAEALNNYNKALDISKQAYDRLRRAETALSDSRRAYVDQVREAAE